MKFGRQFVEAIFAAVNSLRAEDLPYDGSQSIKTKIDSIGGGNLPGLAPGRNSQWGTLQQHPGIATAMDGVGLLQAVTFDDNNSSKINSTEGLYFQQREAGRLWRTSAILRADHNPLAVVKSKIDGTSGGYSFGFDTNGTGASNSNNPSGQYCVMQFRPSRDTNFQLMTKDGSTQTLVDTGVLPVDDEVYYFHIDLDESNTLATLSIYDKDYALLASVSTALTLPTSSSMFLTHRVASPGNLWTFMAHLITRSA